ncbi:MAG TPA: type III pantothenate kinase, partial [Longimicrobiaceae bacterium]|nr:type III pantothenate kinase [Longimicrobiaceae bacterium]
MKPPLLLCLDVGNTQIFGGVYAGTELRATFRKATHPQATSDEFGVFLAAVLRSKGIDPAQIGRIALCSVVPAAVHAIQRACVEYHRVEPFILQAGVKTGLKILYRNPHEVGADRIANALGAARRHPGRNLIVVDCGTATTFDVVSGTGDYLGGAIMPGVGVSAAALAGNTAKLPQVQIARPESPLGRTTVDSINAGLYHGQVGAIRHLAAAL